MSPALTERFEMRLDEETIHAIDRWRFARGGSRAEAARQLISVGLAASDQAEADEKPTPPYSKGETLALFMLCDIVKALKVKEPGIDPDFVQSAIAGGHYWGLEWQYDGIFHDHVDTDEDRTVVLDTLDMWEMLELAHEGLEKSQRQRVAKEATIFGDVKFRGFDGNTEGRYMSIARFLTRDLDRFARFKNRDLNSHMPSIDAYRRMLNVYLPLRNSLVGRTLSEGEVIKILNAAVHPENRK